jgi:hypothetical protein
MILLLLLLLMVGWSHVGLSQPLDDDQYFALMNVYNALGLCLLLQFFSLFFTQVPTQVATM